MIVRLRSCRLVIASLPLRLRHHYLPPFAVLRPVDRSEVRIAQLPVRGADPDDKERARSRPHQQGQGRAEARRPDHAQGVAPRGASASVHAPEGTHPPGAAGLAGVLPPEGGPRRPSTAPLFPYSDIESPEVRLLGTYQWESVVGEREPALFGGWFAAPPPGARRDFEARFEANFGYRPPRLASLAYDAVALAGALAKLPDGRGFSAETLTSGSGFRGVDGIFRFTPDGAIERGLAVLEVTHEGAITIDQAPKSFAGF